VDRAEVGGSSASPPKRTRAGATTAGADPRHRRGVIAPAFAGWKDWARQRSAAEEVSS
jgi:hypothetical protein